LLGPHLGDERADDDRRDGQNLVPSYVLYEAKPMSPTNWSGAEPGPTFWANRNGWSDTAMAPGSSVPAGLNATPSRVR